MTQGPVPAPRKPNLAVPAGSCDAHCHVFGPASKFPFSAETNSSLLDAPLESLENVWRILGFERAVIVQSMSHGLDHSAAIDALRRGAGRYRGVAVVGPESTAAEVAQLHDEGFRGARLHFMPHLASHAMTRDEIDAVVAKVRTFDWHIALHLAGDGILERADLVRSLPGQVVIDHMARVDLREGLDSKPIQMLKRLLDRGNVWVKLSGADRLATAPPSMEDSVALARMLAEHAPERVVWGTDYPHPNTHGFVPDEGDLVDSLAVIAPTEAARRQLLVENPTALFDFTHQ